MAKKRMTTARANGTTYTVTITMGSGSGGGTVTYTSSSSAQSVTVATSKIPTRTGYHLGAWTVSGFTGSSSPTMSLAETSTGYYTLSIPANVEGNFTVTPMFTVDNAGVTGYARWETDGVTLPGATRTGHTFGGWYDKNNTYVGTTGGTYTATEATSLSASWQANPYTLTLTMGTGVSAIHYKSDASQAYKSTSVNTTASVTYDATWFAYIDCKSGYSFSGQGESEGNPYFAVMSENGATYAPNATPNQITISYSGNGSTGGTVTDTVYNYDTSATFKTNTYEKSYAITYNLHGGSMSESTTTSVDFAFDSWNTAASGSGTKFSAGASVTNPCGWTSGTHTVYAQWTGTGSLTLPTPTYEAHYFTGWYTAETGGSYLGKGGDTITVTSDMTIHAQWSDQVYTIRVVVGGTGKETISYCKKTTDETYSFTSQATTGCHEADYTVGSGWTGTEPTVSTTNHTVLIKANTYGDFSISTTLELNHYFIRFNANPPSGTEVSGEMSNQEFVYGTAQNLTKNAFTIAGYAFAGWATDSSGSVVYADTQSISLTTAHNAYVDLYAKWSAIPYTINVSVNDAAMGEASGGATYTINQAATLTATPRAGYVLKWWAYKETPTVALSTDNPYNHTVTANANIQAIFEPMTCAVTLDRYGGTTGSTSVTATYRSAMPSATMPTKEGNTFSGYFDSDGKQYYAADGTSAATWDKTTSTATLTAGWDLNSYTVTFDVKGHGTQPSSQTITYGGKATNPGTLTATGYTFVGWYKDSSCTTAWNFTTDTVTGDTTIYAKWTINSYTLTLDVSPESCGTVSGGGTYAFDTSHSISATAATGYRFKEWQKNSVKISSDNPYAYTVPAASETLTAVFEKIPYTYTIGSQTPITYYYSASAQTKTITVPTETGKHLTGWTASGYTGTAPSISGTTLTIPAGAQYDFTMSPSWAANTYSVAFDKNDEAATGTMTTQTGFNYGVETTLKKNTFTKEDYAFAGWATSAEGEVAYVDEATVINLTATDNDTVTLYAKWGEILTDVTISYRPGSYGIGDNYDVHFTTTPIVLSGILYTRNESYTQDGWSIRSDGTTLDYALNGVYTGSTNITLYPHWSKSYRTASFYVYDEDDGSYGSPYYQCDADDLSRAKAPDDIPSGKAFARFAPELYATRNGVQSLTVSVDGATYTLGRATEHGGRTLAADGTTFLDTWVYSGGTAVYPKIGLVFNDYQTYDVSVTKQVDGTEKTYTGSFNAAEGVSDLLTLSDGSVGTIQVRVTTSYIANTGDVEYYALLKDDTTNYRTLMFWHYGKSASGTSAAVTDKTVTNAKDGDLVSTYKPQDPKITSSDTTSGAWVPTISASTTVSGNQSYEFVFNTKDISLNWNNETVRTTTTVAMTWGHAFPDTITVPTREGYVLTGVYLTKNNDATFEKILCYNSDGKSVASVTLYDVFANPSAYTLVAEWVSTSELVRTLDDLRGNIRPIPELFASCPTSQGTISDTMMSSGFDSDYSVPNGKVVTRYDMNMLGHYGTACSFYEQCGGYWTFDADVCEKIGGYASNAILRFYDADTNTLRTVRSLQDGNTWDFRTQGVDGVHWAYADVNPELNVSIDYSDYLDLSDTLFVETGVPELYEVPYDAYLQLFAVGSVDCKTLQREEQEDLIVVTGIASQDADGGNIKYTYEHVNGAYICESSGASFLDVHNKNTQAFGSIGIGGFFPVSFFMYLYQKGKNTTTGLYETKHLINHFERICPISSFSVGLMLSKGDKIRIRNSLTDFASDYIKSGGNITVPTMQDLVITDDVLKRIYTVRFANLYRRGVSV